MSRDRPRAVAACWRPGRDRRAPPTPPVPSATRAHGTRAARRSSPVLHARPQGPSETRNAPATVDAFMLRTRTCPCIMYTCTDTLSASDRRRRQGVDKCYRCCCGVGRRLGMCRSVRAKVEVSDVALAGTMERT